jgi:hypothetical protein
MQKLTDSNLQFWKSEHVSWVDSLLEASMILGGMGPDNRLNLIRSIAHSLSEMLELSWWHTMTFQNS